MGDNHRKYLLPQCLLRKPETIQNLTSTNIYTFAVFCVGRRSRPMTNFKRDLIRGQKYSQPMGQGVGTSLDPLRFSRLLAEPLGASPAPGGPRAMRTNGAKQWAGGSAGPRASPRGCSAREPKHCGDVKPGGLSASQSFEPLGSARPREPGISPHQCLCNGHGCPGKGSELKAQRAPDTSCSRAPEVPVTV